MAIRASTLEGRVLSFRSKAADAKDILLVSFDGFEAISRPFRFDLELASKKQDIDPAEMMKHPASIVIKRPLLSTRCSSQTEKIQAVQQKSASQRRLEPDTVPTQFSLRSRSAAPPTAPAPSPFPAEEASGPTLTLSSTAIHR